MTTKFDERMNGIFDIEPIENVMDKSLPSISHQDLDIDFKNDYETARENFHELIEKGKEAIDDILTIAKESERGRDFEVAAVLLKNVIEANEKMIELHKKVREIANYSHQKSDSQTTINQAVFVGNTSELSRIIKDLNTKQIGNP